MEESKKVDPDKEGIAINYKPSASTADFRVTFKTVAPISLKAAIEKITEFAQPTPLKYRIDSYAIIIGQDVSDHTISARKILVPSGIIKSPATSAEAKKFLEEKFGIKWEFGASVYYIEDRNYMVVTHIESNLNRIEEFMKSKKK